MPNPSVDRTPGKLRAPVARYLKPVGLAFLNELHLVIKQGLRQP